MTGIIKLRIACQEDNLYRILIIPYPVNKVKSTLQRHDDITDDIDQNHLHNALRLLHGTTW